MVNLFEDTFASGIAFLVSIVIKFPQRSPLRLGQMFGSNKSRSINQFITQEAEEEKGLDMAIVENIYR